MITDIFGNETVEKVLLYLENYGSGYPRQIASTFGISVSQVQNQVARLEREGVIVSRLVGKTRVYQWNPRYLFIKELHIMLKKALRFLPENIHDKYFRTRTRPRRQGKPLP